MGKKIILGILTIVFLTASIYVMLPDSVRIDIGMTKSTFKVWENGSWVISGVEYVNLFDGTAKMRAKERTLENNIFGNTTMITRTSLYKEDIIVVERYMFDGNVKDVELFPVEHSIEVIGADRPERPFILQYEVQKLLYDGKTIKDISSPQSFGHKMQVEWENGNYYSKIYKYILRDEGKLTVRYKIDSDDYFKNVRLFDPPEDIVVTLNSPADNYYSPTTNVTFNCSANVTGASLSNISLWSNFSGVWEINESYENLTDESTHIYDEINDSSIDLTLWNHTVTNDDSGASTTFTWEENTDFMTYYTQLAGIAGVDYSRHRTTELRAYNLIDRSGINNITFRAKGVSSGSGDGLGSLTLVVFGTSVATITNDDSVWTVLKNESEGVNKFTIYNDGVFDETITATNNNITFRSYIRRAQNNYQTNLSVYYLYYEQDYLYEITKTFEKNISSSNIWNCQSCDNESDCNFAPANRTVYLDEQSPQVDIIYPTAINYTSNVSDLNYSASDENEDKCWSSIDNGTTNSTVSFGENFTGLISSEGSNTWTVYCNDTVGQENSSSVIFWKDTILPLIEYSANSDTSNSSGNFDDKDWVFINVTVNEISVSNVTFWTWTSTNTSFNKTTVTNQADIYTLNQTGLSKDVYFWNVTVCDYWNNCNTTSERYYGDEVVNLSINGFFENKNVELGTTINITANNTYDYIFVDINHPNYGNNYSIGKWGTTFQLLIEWFRKTLFAEGSNSSAIGFNSITDYNGSKFNVTSHQYDEVVNFSVNISGTNNPYDVGIFKCNTSTNDIDNYDRFFYGNLTSEGYIYQNKLVNTTGFSTTENLSFYNAGEKYIYFYLDDGANLVNFLFNVSSVESGFEYFENLTNFSNVDTTNTDAQLDISGAIMPKNSSLSEFVYDSFGDSTVDTEKWVKTADFSNSGSAWSYSGTISETGGYLRMYNTWSDPSEEITGSGALDFSPNNSFFTLYDSDSIIINLSNTYGSSSDDTGCSGNTFLYLGSTLAWTNYYEVEVDSTHSESSTANLIFNLTKYNSTHWRVQISGVESSSLYDSTSCGAVSGVYNWTKGVYNISKFSCSNVNGDLDNDFYSPITYGSTYPFRIRNFVSLDNIACNGNTIDTKIYYVNNSLYSRENSTTISNSIFDSSGNIASATMTVAGLSGTNESVYLYMSADNGDNWESVANGVLHSFSDVGRNLKWKINFNMTSGYKNVTSRITDILVNVEGGNLSDVYFDVGDDGTYEYSILGNFTEENGTIVVDLSNAVLNYSSDPVFANTYPLTVVINSSSAGQLNIDKINLTYNPNPVYLDITSIQDFLDTMSGIKNFSIDVAAYGLNAFVNLTDLKFDYKGGNKTYTITAHNNDSSESISRNITYYYSSFFKNLPYTWTDTLFFLPRTNSSKNVVAYGQTSTKPAYNLTTTNYGGNINLSIRVDESFSCLNITWNTNNTKPSGNKINTTWQNMSSNLEYLNNKQLWLWADFDNCNGSDQRILQPSLEVESYCSDCIWI